jgi:hypothetical protein
MTRFYQEVYGLERNFSDIRLPVSREGFDWLLIADERVSAQMAYESCQKQFNCWKYDNRSLDDVAVPTNDRDQSKGTYAIRLRDTVEADEVHRNRSANDLKAAGINGITLREQLILVRWYYWKTGKHLDIQNITLCSGSRTGNGLVPYVGLCLVEMEPSIYWCFPDDCRGSLDGQYRSLHVREVVS